MAAITLSPSVGALEATPTPPAAATPRGRRGF